MIYIEGYKNRNPKYFPKMTQTYNIDCMAAMAQMKDNEFDLCITDPPYGVELEYNTYNDSLDNWHELMSRFIPEIRRVCKMVIMPSCSINKLHWIYTHHTPDWLMCWMKGSPGHVSAIGFNDWEPLLVYGRIKGLSMHDVINMTNGEKMGNHNHPCPKPVKWFKWFYHRIGKKQPLRIIDPFMGSGSSRIAAHDMGFDFIGYEIDKDYFDAQEKRFANHIKQGSLFNPKEMY